MRNAKRATFIFILTLCIIAAVGGILVYRQGPSVQQSVSTPYRTAPAFELPDSKGKKHRLEELRGNVVLLHFWASWCPPCLDEIPQWVELGNKFRDRPFQMVAVSLDQNWADALRILPDQKLNSNVLSLLDISTKIPDHYGTYQFPETYLLSPDLRILMKWVGPQNWSGPEIQEMIEKVLHPIEEKQK